MEITSVKILADGYLVNNELSVPNNEGNRHYKLIQEWIGLGNTHDPEYTQAEIDAKVELDRVQTIKDEAQARIIALIPNANEENFIIKELNLVMLNAEIDKKRALGETLTTADLNSETLYVSLKDNIKTIRSMSDTAELNGDSLTRFQGDLTLAGV